MYFLNQQEDSAGKGIAAKTDTQNMIPEGKMV